MPLNPEYLQQKLTEFQNKNEIRERLIKQYATLGYVIKPGDIFYKTAIGEEDVWGLKVGQITYLDHIHTTEMVVLFFINRKPETLLVSDNWLLDSITI